MDSAKLSRFPHLTWLGATFNLQPDSSPWCVNWQSDCHSLCLTIAGQYSVRWIHEGRESRWVATRGTVHFMPRDGRQHVLLTDALDPCNFFLAFVPWRHVSLIAESEGLAYTADTPRLLIPNDCVLQQSLLALSSCTRSLDDDHGRADEAARRVILRLAELSGAGTPDWHDDASVFDRRTLRHLVEYIDAHLEIAPSLSEMGLRVGLSPSHFAKKFRGTTGLSLHRFVNRRRIRASMESLKQDSKPLAHVALDVGFSSQAHFTHVFCGLTGVTPARFRKLFRRVVG